MGVFDGVAALLARSVFRKSLDGYCRLVTTEDEHSFVSDDGSLSSVFALDGFRSIPGGPEVTEAVERLRVGLSAYLGTPGHSLQFWFGHAPELSKAEIEAIVRDTSRTAADSGLDLADLMAERRTLLPEKLSGERCYLVLWSRPSLLTKQERKDDTAAIVSTRKAMKPAITAQALGIGFDSLLVRHTAVCDALVREFSSSGIVLEKLSTHEALSVMRGIQNPVFMEQGRTWKGVLPGDYVRARMPSHERELKRGDVSNLLWPMIARQVMTEHADVIDQQTVELGDYVFSGFDVTIGPEVIVEFNSLVRRILESEDRISWRCSMTLDSGGFQGQTFKEQYASLFTWTAPLANGRISRAFERLRQSDGAGDTVIRWRASFATWCHKDDRAKLRRTVSVLRRTVERWGNCQTDALVGDPLECVMSSGLGLSSASTAPTASASMAEALALAPIARPASPWPQGAVLMRTGDGKLWPYQPGSSQQMAWVDVIVGTPGSGKSVLMNTINLGVALSRQSGRSDTGEGLLPRISIIDIGPSSSGLISLIRDALPVHRRHEAVYHRLKMDDRFAVNPFDTQLGLRKPLAHERGFLINLVSLICTADGETSPMDGVSQMAAATIDAAYSRFADDRNAKKYVLAESFEIDAAIRASGIICDSETTWWEVTDALFAAGKLHEASLAQRFAVPTLADLILVSNDPTVTESFKEMRTKTSERLLTAFQRMVTAATKDFPILSKPTRFDLSNARVIAFDLADVSSTAGPQAKRQTAIMYMMARQAVTVDFWLDVDELRGLNTPEAYREHHIRRCENNRQMPKRLCFDEYHLTGGLGVRDQVVQDVRVGRKAGVQISLASQLLDDFDRSIQDLASTFFFCNVPTERAIEETCATYNLGSSVRAVMRELRGPIDGVGAPVLARMTLRSGTYVQPLINQPGPIELWALSTTAEDASLRSILYERLGSKAARQLLAKRFPSGSAKRAIERRLADLEDRGQSIDDNARGDALKTLANELISEMVQ